MLCLMLCKNAAFTEFDLDMIWNDVFCLFKRVINMLCEMLCKNAAYT